MKVQMRRTKDRQCGRCRRSSDQSGVRASRYNLSEWLPRQQSFDTRREIIWTLFFTGSLTDSLDSTACVVTWRLQKQPRFPPVSTLGRTKSGFAVGALRTFVEVKALVGPNFTFISSFLRTFAMKELAWLVNLCKSGEIGSSMTFVALKM